MNDFFTHFSGLKKIEKSLKYICLFLLSQGVSVLNYINLIVMFIIDMNQELVRVFSSSSVIASIPKKIWASSCLIFITACSICNLFINSFPLKKDNSLLIME